MKSLVDSNEIPIIDLNFSDSEVKNLDEKCIQRIAKELDEAMSKHGTALFINHGICQKKRQKLSEYFKKFSELPPDIKNKYMVKKNHGYITTPSVKRQNQDITEILHAFNFGNTMESQIPEKELPGFRDTIISSIREFTNLQILILKAFAAALNIPSDFFHKIHGFISEEPQFTTTFRLLYYPAMKDVDFDQIKADNKTRFGPHFDYGSFTLLATDSEGLEVIKPGTNVWRPVGHLSNAIQINGGQILEIWSKKRYQAIMHRVVIPEEELLKNRARFCQVLFVHSTPECPVAPIESVLNGTCPDGTLSSGEFAMQKLSETFANYNILDDK